MQVTYFALAKPKPSSQPTLVQLADFYASFTLTLIPWTLNPETDTLDT